MARLRRSITSEQRPTAATAPVVRTNTNIRSPNVLLQIQEVGRSTHEAMFKKLTMQTSGGSRRRDQSLAVHNRPEVLPADCRIEAALKSPGGYALIDVGHDHAHGSERRDRLPPKCLPAGSEALHCCARCFNEHQAGAYGSAGTWPLCEGPGTYSVLSLLSSRNSQNRS